MVEAAQIEAIERATLAAVAPEEVLEIDSWLIGLDPGSIRRAASAYLCDMIFPPNPPFSTASRPPMPNGA